MDKCPHCEREFMGRNRVRAHINFAHLGRRPPIAISKALILLNSKGVIRCAVCKKEKLPSEFPKTKENSTGFSTWCRECHAANVRKRKGTPNYVINGIRGSAKTRGILFELTVDQLKSFWKQPCTYCGRAVETIGIDRVDSSKAYTLDNIVSCCTTCNYMKHILTAEEFIAHCQKVVDHAALTQRLKTG
jgi:hypothetical protein